MGQPNEDRGPRVLLQVERHGPHGVEGDEVDVSVYREASGFTAERWGKVLACIAHSVEKKWGITREQQAKHFNAELHRISMEGGN